MRALSRVLSVGLLTGLVSLACKDSSGPGNGAASITGKAGDGQSAATGAVLPVPLSFVVLNSAGQPLQGASVNWTVPTGTATVNPTISTTDALGTASTTVTLGGAIGQVTVRGTVAGLAPVDFHLTVLDPCSVALAYTVGATADGVLTTSDCTTGGGIFFTDFYEFTVGSQQGIIATMSAGFRAWMDGYRGSGRQMAYAAGIDATNTAATLELILAPGTYVLAPNSYSENVTGPYTLASVAQTPSLGCGQVWATRNVVIADSIIPSCFDSTATGVFYVDLVGVIAFANDTLQVTQRSTAIDPLLTLFRIEQNGAFVAVATNDDSAAGTADAFISYPVTQTAVYVVYISSADSAGRGAYTLTVGGSVSLGPTRFPAPWRSPAWPVNPAGRLVLPTMPRRT